ncbi:MAG: EamA family transporter, partial [Clostridiales bacterium]|nr:EamA family transporter [Clostridiales bacterium]
LDRGYSSLTINFYSCLLASVGAAIIWKPFHLMRVMTDTSITSGTSVPAWVWGVAIGVFSCFIPYLLYTYGLTGLENGKASVLASIEPVVASLVGVLYYHEKMSLATAVGIVLVLGAVVLVNAKLGTGRKGEAFI